MISLQREAIGAYALQGSGQAEGRVNRLFVVVHLGTKNAAGERVLRISRNFHRLPVHNLDQ
jgi:hypothetical protein